LVNIGVFVLIASVIIIPTMIISRIDPVKAIKFD
jgi:hypothetical protein